MRPGIPVEKRGGGRFDRRFLQFPHWKARPYAADSSDHRSMAIAFLKLKVSNPARPQKSKEYQFLVDSGAIYSVIPKEELKPLGIKATSYEEFTLANGEIIRSPVGNSSFEYKGKIRAPPVIFGEKGIFLLGATTLEALGMILDPIRRELKPLPMVLMPIGRKFVDEKNLSLGKIRRAKKNKKLNMILLL